MRAGSSDDGDDDDDTQSMDSSGRKGRKGAKAKRKSAGGRKRSRDAAPHTLQADAQMLGGLNLTDLGTAGLEGFSVEGGSAGMRLGNLPNMNLFTGGALGGMPGLGGMMMLPGLGSGGFGAMPSTSAGLGMPGALPLHSADGSILGTHGMMGSLGMLHSAPTSAPLASTASISQGGEQYKPASIDLPAHVSSLLQPMGDSAVLSTSPAYLHPEETVIVLARHHPGTNTTIPLQWSSHSSSGAAAAATSAALVAASSAGGSSTVNSPAGMRGLDNALGALAGIHGSHDVNALLKAPGTASLGAAAVTSEAAGGSKDVATHLIHAAVNGDKQAVAAAAQAVAAGSKSGLGEDDKTRVATVLASLGNGDYDGSATPSGVGAAEAEGTAKKPRKDSEPSSTAVGV